jgi:hypothetical protein
VSTLRSSLDELRVEDLRFAADEGLVADLDELKHASRVIDSERARRLDEINRRGYPAVDGSLSTSAWLAHRHPMPASAAAAQLRFARALGETPAAAEALTCGEVSAAAVGELIRAREGRENAFEAAEEALVGAARALSFGSCDRSSPTGGRPPIPISPSSRRTSVSRGAGCMCPPPSRGWCGSTAISIPRPARRSSRPPGRDGRGARTTERRDEDLRTPSQRRPDAFGEICRRWLDAADRPTVAGERPHVVVSVDLRALRGEAGQSAELEDVGPVTAETARRWACDANVTRVVTEGRSEPLDLGRRTKVVPAPLRRAVTSRDHGCRFPGCQRPPGWCDAHHVVHWADGGPTALGNLVLLCRPHHRMIHRGFRVEMVDGAPRFERPDGSPLEDRAAP